MNPAFANAKPLPARARELIRREIERRKAQGGTIDKLRRAMGPNPPSGTSLLRALNGYSISEATLATLNAFAATLECGRNGKPLPNVNVEALTLTGHPISFTLSGDEAAWLGESRRCYSCMHLVVFHVAGPLVSSECAVPDCECAACSCDPCREGS